MECAFQQQRPVGVFRQPAPQPGRFGGGQQHTLLPQPKAPQVIAFQWLRDFCFLLIVSLFFTA